MLERFRKPPSPAAAILAHYAAIERAPMVESKPSPAPVKPNASPEEAVAIVTAMADLGCIFVPGRCPDTASPMWMYRAPLEHAAECDLLAGTIPYDAFVVAIHRLPPGSIKPELLPPPPVTAHR